MKVRFSYDALNSQDCFSQLDEILYLFGRKRHIWDTENRNDIVDSAWMKDDPGGRASVREVFEKTFRNNFFPKINKAHTKTIIVTIASKKQSIDELTPGEAIRCLNEPVYVAVENADTDGKFFGVMIDVFERLFLREAYKCNWWRWENLGGYGETGKAISRLKNISIGPLRLIVLADSDRCFPDDVSDTIKKVRQSCEKENVKYFILKKRAIENYMPRRVWEKRCPKDHRRRLSYFLSLSQEQRDFYPVKKGFRNSLSTDLKDERQIAISQFYGDVSSEKREELRTGFGEIVEWFVDEKDEIWKSDMLNICGCEFEILFDLIESFL